MFSARVLRQSGNIILSALVHVRNSPFDALKPSESAVGSFLFSWVMTLIRLSDFLYFSIISAVLSVEPSFTIISSRFLKLWLRMLSIDSAITFSPLNTGKTTETMPLTHGTSNSVISVSKVFSCTFL